MSDMTINNLAHVVALIKAATVSCSEKLSSLDGVT